MAHKRRARVRYHSIRGGHYGHFGPRYLGYRIPVGGRRHHRRSRRTRSNPFFGNPGGRGGTNWLLIGGVAVGAFFLLRGGGLSSIFGGAAAPAGYTPIGTTGYYRGPDGMVYQQSASGMVRSATQYAAGSTVEDQLIQQAIRSGVPIVASAIPSVIGGIGTGIGELGSWLGNLFTGGSATGAIPTDSGGSTVTAPDVLSGAYGAPSSLPPLPDIGSLSLSDWWSAPATADWWSQPVQASEGFTTEIPYSLGVPSLDLSLAPLAPLPDYGGFFGLGGFGRMPVEYHAARHGFGIARRGPSGEVEARFLRQAPRYN